MVITPKAIALALIAGLTILLVWTVVSRRQSPALPILPAGNTAQPKTIYETKEESNANVTVSITPIALSPGQSPKFKIVFETHSVDLDFDVAAITTLLDDQGTALGPAIWKGTPPGGHHRNGVLIFQKPLGNSVKQISLTFKDIAGISTRSLTWNIKP